MEIYRALLCNLQWKVASCLTMGFTVLAGVSVREGWRSFMEKAVWSVYAVVRTMVGVPEMFSGSVQAYDCDAQS